MKGSLCLLTFNFPIFDIQITAKQSGKGSRNPLADLVPWESIFASGCGPGYKSDKSGGSKFALTLETNGAVYRESLLLFIIFTCGSDLNLNPC